VGGQSKIPQEQTHKKIFRGEQGEGVLQKEQNYFPQLRRLNGGIGNRGNLMGGSRGFQKKCLFVGGNALWESKTGGKSPERYLEGSPEDGSTKISCNEPKRGRTPGSKGFFLFSTGIQTQSREGGTD